MPRFQVVLSRHQTFDQILSADSPEAAAEQAQIRAMHLDNHITDDWQTDHVEEIPAHVDGYSEAA